MESVIRNFQQYGHFGISKVYSLRELPAKIGLFIRSCEVCQKCKFPNRALSGEMHPIVAEQPSDLVTVDYYGPLPESRSRVSYIFAVIDSFSKFVKMYPLRRAQAKLSAQRVLDFHRTVPTKVVLSDHGTQFQSKQWQETLEQWDIQPTFSTVRQPQSNPTGRRSYRRSSCCSTSRLISALDTLPMKFYWAKIRQTGCPSSSGHFFQRCHSSQSTKSARIW
jgi:hypothetical protein